jgi:hypothetical protein
VPPQKERLLRNSVTVLIKSAFSCFIAVLFTPKWLIGTLMSSGCIRMMNQDVIDLYRRAPKRTKIVVLSTRSAMTIISNPNRKSSR